MAKFELLPEVAEHFRLNPKVQTPVWQTRSARGREFVDLRKINLEMARRLADYSEDLLLKKKSPPKTTKSSGSKSNTQ